LFDLFSNDSAEKAAALANQGLQQGYSQLSDLYGQGRGAINTGYGQAQDVLSGALGQYAPGAAAYGDVSGANGIAGLQRGTDLFKNSGQYGVYGFANDQAQQALQRAHAAAGNLGSGNTDTDAMKYAAGLAGQNWGQFQQGLQPYLSGYGTAAANLGNAYTGQANALNASFTGQGGAANATQTGIGQNLAGAELNNYKVGANQLNALLGVGSLAAGGLGGLGGIGGALGGIGGALGGNAYGGSASSPLPGLSAADYGDGSSLADRYGVGGGLFSAFS
jgi:hypothetical protein